MEQRLKQVNGEIRRLEKRQARRAKLEAQKRDLYLQREERDAKQREAAAILTKERADVEKLEGKSLRSLLLSLSGDKQARLSQERREEMAARFQYDQALRDLEYIDQKIQEVLNELRELDDDTARMDALRMEKEQLLRDMGGEAGRRLAQLDMELAALDAQRREVDEARQAGKQAQDALDGVRSSLDSAQNLGMWDMLGGGLLVTMAKHRHIDEARSGIDYAQQCLSRFRTELADVDICDCPQVNIGSFATFADYFFDGLLSDWVVQSGIRDAKGSVDDVYDKVCQALYTLDGIAMDLEERRAPLEAERARIVAQA